MTTKISIIIAVYNGAETLERCLESILGQSCNNYDLIISDGGSTDGTVEILKKYSESIYFWESKPDKGIADAWNNALSHIKSEWVLFLGSDDYLNDELVLENMIDHLDTNCDIVYGSLILRYHDNDVYISETFNSNKFKRRMSIPHTAAFHNSELFKRYGNYDLSFKIALDYEFLLRKHDLKVKHIDRMVTIMSAGGVSSNLVFKSLIEMRSAQIKNKAQHIILIEYYFVVYFIIKLLQRLLQK